VRVFHGFSQVGNSYYMVIYSTTCHAPIWSQQVYFYRCHIWNYRYEIPPIRNDGILFSSHRGVSCLGYHELTKVWKLGGVVECHVSKVSIAYATLKTIVFHYEWCPIRTLSIVVGYTLIFNFLLHYLMLVLC